MNRKIFFILILSLALFSFKSEEAGRVTLFMIGDSTMSDKDVKGGSPERGWGQMLPGFLREDIRVDNHAMNGRSTKSFIDEGRWETVRSLIKANDYVFIQFGHNDQKEDEARHTDPNTTYRANLKRFIEETRAKKGIPVLLTPIVRRQFNEDGTVKDTHGDYLTVTREVAGETDAPLIDLNRLTHDWLQALGDGSTAFFTDNTHLNIAGGRAVARLAASSLPDLVPGLSPYIRDFDYVVAQDGSGDFFTIQEAIAAVPDYRKKNRTRLLIRKGVYKEKLILAESKINVSLTGEDGTVISFDDYALKKNIYGEEKSTSGSATCYFYADNLYVENITFENTSGPVGQAVAMLTAGDRTVFRKCRFLGFQDTLYTYGKANRQYYEDCYIEGSVDFIFGWSTVVFNRCTIHSNRNGYVTAPSTPEGRAYGYVFLDCRLTANDDVDKVYLSRPWRNFAKAVFIRCDLGKHIHPAGWHNWKKEDAEKTVLYAEYQSTGEGADPASRAAFSRQLDDIGDYSIEQILKGEDGWNPLTTPEILITTSW